MRIDEDSYRLRGFSCQGPDACNIFSSLAIGITFVDVPPAYSCEGFKGPLAKGAVAIKNKRQTWLRAKLHDEDGGTLRGGDLVAAPLLEVTFEPAADAITAPLAPGIDGSAFDPQGSHWRLRLDLEAFADPGSYTVRMVSGDPSEYRIDPTCEGAFVC